MHALGRFPVATAAAAARRPVRATAGHPGVVVMGETVEARLPVSVDVAVTARGPEFQLPQTIPLSSRGVITVSVLGVHGISAVRAADFYAVDGKHRRVGLNLDRLVARDGASKATTATSVGPGRRLTFTFSAMFVAGDASLVWRPDGVALGVWDFTADYD